MMLLAIVAHMADVGVKKVVFIGFADAYGEGWYGEFSKAVALKHLHPRGRLAVVARPLSRVNEVLNPMRAGRIASRIVPEPKP